MLRVTALPLTVFLLAALGMFMSSEWTRDSWTPGATLDIEVTGEDFGWRVRYPGPDGELHTSDDRFGTRDVHVPTGTHARLHLVSADYVYTLELPRYGLKEIAVPDLEFTIEFDAVEAGRTALRGSQMCGYIHPRLLGTLVVESPDEYVEAVRAMEH